MRNLQEHRKIELNSAG